MRPIEQIVPGFKLPVTIFAKDQSEYHPLPAFKCQDGMVVTRWHFSFLERLKLLITGSLWLTLLTFNKPLQPVKLSLNCPIMGHTGYDKEC